MTTAYRRWRVLYHDLDDRQRELMCWRKDPEEAAAFARETLSLDGLGWKWMWVEDTNDEPIVVDHG